jgi:hypothetical protein
MRTYFCDVGSKKKGGWGRLIVPLATALTLLLCCFNYPSRKTHLTSNVTWVLNTRWFILVSAMLPIVLYLLADVSEHLISSICWGEVIKENKSFRPRLKSRLSTRVISAMCIFVIIRGYAGHTFNAPCCTGLSVVCHTVPCCFLSREQQDFWKKTLFDVKKYICMYKTFIWNFSQPINISATYCTYVGLRVNCLHFLPDFSRTYIIVTCFISSQNTLFNENPSTGKQEV